MEKWETVAPPSYSARLLQVRYYGPVFIDTGMLRITWG